MTDPVTDLAHPPYPALLPYENLHAGESAVILGTGMSIKDGLPESILSGRIVFSVNTIIFHPTLAGCVDYYFMMDNGAAKDPNSYTSRKREYDAYRPKREKFYGAGVPQYCPTEEDAVRADAAFFRVGYGTTQNPSPYRGRWTWDLVNEPLGDMSSVIFAAMQFAMWMGLRDWVIAGCDCDGERFSGGRPVFPSIVRFWRQFAPMLRETVRIRQYKPTKAIYGMFAEVLP